MKTRVLVIEDNPASLELMGYLLETLGYTLITAGSGEEGLEAARREAPDLILCDIQLPGMDGYEIARQLKRHPALGTIPLVAVTALAMVGDRERVLASGFDGYIVKPIVPENFVNQFKTFLRPDQRMSFQRPVPEEAPTTPAPTPLHKGTILIVDDSPTNIAFFSSLLESSGYTVVAAENIKDGMKFANQYVLDMIVSDIQIRSESGYDFLKRVKADPRLRSVPFIFLSSSNMWEKDRAIGLSLGADRFITRPIEPLKLLTAIEDVLREYKDGSEEASPGATPPDTAQFENG